MVQITRRLSMLAAFCTIYTHFVEPAAAAAISARRPTEHKTTHHPAAVLAAPAPGKRLTKAAVASEPKSKLSKSRKANAGGKTSAAPSEAKSAGTGSSPGAGKASSRPSKAPPLPARIPKSHGDKDVKARASFTRRRHRDHDNGHRHHDHGDEYTKVVVNGDNDRVRVGDRVFSSRVLGRRAPIPMPEPHYHEHDWDHHRHGHHHDDDYTKIIVNGDDNRVRVDRRAATGLVIPGEEDDAYVVAGTEVKPGAVEVVINGNNKTVYARDVQPMRIPGTVDIVSPVANSTTGARLASLFLVPSNNGTYMLDASQHNHTQVYMVVQPPVPSTTAPLSRVENADDIPVRMEVDVLDKTTATMTQWCATYDPNPASEASLAIEQCRDLTKGPAPEHKSQTFLWNKKDSSVRPLWLVQVAAKNNDEDDQDAEDDSAAAAEALHAAKVAAYQSSYTPNSSRPPIMAAAAALNSTAPSNTTTLASAPSSKDVTLVFRPDAPEVAAKAEAPMSSSSAAPASSSPSFGATEATMTSSSSASTAPSTTATASASSSDAAKVEEVDDPSMIQTATPWTSAALPLSTEPASSSMSAAPSSAMKLFAAADPASTTASSPASRSASASRTGASSAPTASASADDEAQVFGIAAAPSSSASKVYGSTITLTSTVTATATATVTPTPSPASSSSASAAPSAAAAQFLDAQDVDTATTATATPSASTTRTGVPSASATPVAGVLAVELVEGKVGSSAAPSSSAPAPSMTPGSTAPYMWRFRRDAA